MATPPPHNPVRRSPLADRLFGWAAQGAALLTLGLLFGILISLLVGAWPAISKYGLGFLTSSVWDPVKNEYGGLVMIYGTLATSLIALVIAVPVSFGIALFLTELSPAWLKRPLGTAIELLAAVPSIVYGMQTLVSDLLTLSRLEGSPSPSANEWTTLGALLAQCEQEAKALSAVIAPQGHRLEFESGPVSEIAGVQTELYSAMN